MSTGDLKAEAEEVGRRIAALQGRLLCITGELDRRLAWHADGATSMGAWLAERTGVSIGTGQLLARLAGHLWDLPTLAGAFEAGEVSLDKVRTVVPFTTPETDADITSHARRCSVHRLGELGRLYRDADGHAGTGGGRGTGADGDAGDGGADGAEPHAGADFGYVRCNDSRRTITARLPEADYALVKGRLDELTRHLPTDGETPLDRRRAHALVKLCGDPTGPGSGGRHLVVAHIDYGLLQGGEGWADLERFGFISAETARRIACGADVVVAFDDDVGHSMYEGRSRRLATDTQRREVWRRDRHCRFPGCAHKTFTHVHHVVPWDPDGLTDLPNLVLLCEHHHRRVHEGGWRVHGDANEELTFVGPTGRAMRSTPSPLWGIRRARPSA